MSGCFSQIVRPPKMIAYQEVQIYDQNVIKSKDLFEKLIDQDSFISQEKSSFRTNQEINIVPLKRLYQGCRCQRISCLKMYCECFSKESHCSDKCQCISCRNNSNSLKQLDYAKQRINYKCPGIFKDVSVSTSRRRCTCKKSGCSKKYCQCFKLKIKCTQQCQCLDCQNGKPHQHEDFFDSSLRVEVNV